MILLATPLEGRDECAAALQEAIGQPVVTAENLLRATTLLRTGLYTVAIFDGQLMESEPNEMETVIEHLGTVIPLEVNLAISGLARLVRQVKAALRRRKQEMAAARQAAVRALHGELNGTLTTVLLNCELAMQVADAPAQVTERLDALYMAAQKMRVQLA